MGWARANIIYEKMRKLPEPGSPMEILHVLVWQMKQKIEFQKSRVLVQSLLAQKDADDATIKKTFEDLKEAFFPFEKNVKSAELEKFRLKLFSEVAKGPLSITVLEDPARQPKMRSKLERGRKELAKRVSLEKSGQVMEMDAFQKANRRPRGAF